MIDERAIFIIPGFKHTPTQKAYKEIALLLKSEGYLPIQITIPWKQTTISENTAYFLKEFKKIRAKKKYILGFSFGAMIAFIASTKVEVSGLILCSLSPYFKEDLVKTNGSLVSSLEKESYQDFSQLHCGSLAKKIKAKQILMLYGTKEAKSLIKRVHEAFDEISSKQKYLFPILNTAHEIGDERYVNKILQIVKTLK